MTGDSPGAKLRAAIDFERPLQVVGAINAYAAMLAEHAGFRAIYLSGAGVANASFGLPDLGVTTLNDVVEDVRRITGATKLPFDGACAACRAVRPATVRHAPPHAPKSISTLLWRRLASTACRPRSLPMPDW